MEERKSCWPRLLLGLLGLAILGYLMNYVGDNSARNMTENTRGLAQEGLDTAGYTFARAEADDGILRVAGSAPDQASAQAACKAAEDKIKSRLGLPGVFNRVECALTYPGSDVAANAAPAAQPSAPSSNSVSAIPAAAKVEADTCQTRLSEAGKSGVVRFAKSRGDILEGQDVLQRVAVIAKECGRFAIEVGGHTDTGGAADFNQRLSEIRANAVRAFLINQGVPSTQLSAKGFGETRPLVNDFPNGNADVPGQPDSPLRAQNRRIEFTVSALQ